MKMHGLTNPKKTIMFYFLLWCNIPSRPRPPHYRGFTILLRSTYHTR